MSHSKGFRKLPLTTTPSKRKRIGRGRRKASGDDKESSPEEPEPLRMCVVQEDFTDDELSFEVGDPSPSDTEEEGSGTRSGSDDDDSDSL